MQEGCNGRNGRNGPFTASSHGFPEVPSLPAVEGCLVGYRFETEGLRGIPGRWVCDGGSGGGGDGLGGREGRRSGRRGASMQEAGASEVGGACRLGWVRVRMRAADLAPLAGVASATETR